MVLPVSLEKSTPANMSHSLCVPLPRSICFQLLVDSLDIYLQIPASLNWYFLSFQSYVLAFCYKDEVWLSFTALPTSPTVYQYSILALSPSLDHPCVFVMVLSIFDLLHYGLVVLYVWYIPVVLGPSFNLFFRISYFLDSMSSLFLVYFFILVQQIILHEKGCMWGKFQTLRSQFSILFFCLFVCFWLRWVARRILIPQLGIEPTPPAMETWSLNHWTAREVPSISVFIDSLAGYRILGWKSFSSLKSLLLGILVSIMAFEKSEAFVWDLVFLSGIMLGLFLDPSNLKFHSDNAFLKSLCTLGWLVGPLTLENPFL